jgi:hypothetical protein
MLRPPIFIELTSSDDGAKLDININDINQMKEFQETVPPRSGTYLIKFLELGCLTPQGIQCASMTTAMREKKYDIKLKIKQAIQAFQKVLMRGSEEFPIHHDDED